MAQEVYKQSNLNQSLLDDGLVFSGERFLREQLNSSPEIFGALQTPIMGLIGAIYKLHTSGPRGLKEAVDISIQNFKAAKADLKHKVKVETLDKSLELLKFNADIRLENLFTDSKGSDRSQLRESLIEVIDDCCNRGFCKFLELKLVSPDKSKATKTTDIGNFVKRCEKLINDLISYANKFSIAIESDSDDLTKNANATIIEVARLSINSFFNSYSENPTDRKRGTSYVIVDLSAVPITDYREIQNKKRKLKSLLVYKKCIDMDLEVDNLKNLYYRNDYDSLLSKSSKILKIYIKEWIYNCVTHKNPNVLSDLKDTQDSLPMELSFLSATPYVEPTAENIFECIECDKEVDKLLNKIIGTRSKEEVASKIEQISEKIYDLVTAHTYVTKELASKFCAIKEHEALEANFLLSGLLKTNKKLFSSLSKTLSNFEKRVYLISQLNKEVAKILELIQQKNNE